MHKRSFWYIRVSCSILHNFASTFVL